MGVKATTGEFVVGDKRGAWFTTTLRINIVTSNGIEAVGTCSLEYLEVDGESLKGDVVVMDTDYREHLASWEFVRVPKRV